MIVAPKIADSVPAPAPPALGVIVNVTATPETGWPLGHSNLVSDFTQRNDADLCAFPQIK